MRRWLRRLRRARMAGPRSLGHWARGVGCGPARAGAARRGCGSGPARALAEAHGGVVAQSDLTLIAYAPHTAPELLTLDLCAARETLDQAARYRLTRQSFVRARALGWDAAQATTRLERLTGAPLPGPMRVALATGTRRLPPAPHRRRDAAGGSHRPDARRAAGRPRGRRLGSPPLTPTAALIHPTTRPRPRLAPPPRPPSRDGGGDGRRTGSRPGLTGLHDGDCEGR